MSLRAVTSIVVLTTALGRLSSPAQELLPPPQSDRYEVGRQYLPAPAMPTPPPALDVNQVEPNPAQPCAASFDLDTLLTLALDNNPTLRQARTQVSAELGKALEAGFYPNPMLWYSGELIGARNNAGTPTAGEFQGAIVSQEIVTAGKLRLSRQKYLQRARVSEHLAVAQQYKVLNDVRMQFYRSLALLDVLNIQRDLLRVAEDRALTVREMYNQGQAQRPQTRQADIALQRSRLDLLTIENEYAQRFQELTSLVGIKVERGRLLGQLTVPEVPIAFDAALNRLWTESPQLAAARAKLVADQVTVRREKVQWVPNLTFSGGTGYDFSGANGASMAGLGLNVPLFDRNQGTVQQAQADLMRQRNEVRRVEWLLRGKLAEVYQRYLTAYQHAHEYERVILPEARAAYRELLESYQQNRTEWPDVLDAQHEYFVARKEYVRHLETLRVNEVLIVGFLLQDGLDAAPGPTPPGHIDSVPKPR